MHAVLESVEEVTPLKEPSDSISEGLIFSKFSGGMPPDPPRFGMLCMLDSCSTTCICAPPFYESWIRPCKAINYVDHNQSGYH